MKRCSHCGREYGDDVTVCSIDGKPLMESQENRKEIAVQPAAAQKTFDVKLISPVSSSGTYRVFCERSDLIFIQIEGGSKSVLAAIAPLLGPAGNVIHLALWLFTKKKGKDQLQKIERQNPEDLLRESRNNFKLYLAEIRDAAIEPPAFVSTSSKAGRLNLLVRHGEKLKFEFASAADISKAIHLLAPLLNSTLRISVEWNEEKQRFERKKII
jgi:hypothetical protein